MMDGWTDRWMDKVITIWPPQTLSDGALITLLMTSVSNDDLNKLAQNNITGGKVCLTHKLNSKTEFHAHLDLPEIH